MEFPFNCEKLLGTDAEGFVVIDGRKGMNQSLGANRAAIRSMPDVQNQLYDLIDRMGTASAKA